VKYISTRGKAPAISFYEALLQGLAPDGGLYMPEAWPALPDDWRAQFRDARFQDVALWVAQAFAGASYSDDELRNAVESAYAGFDDESIAPLRELEPGLFLLELFHGPTLAFKDFAMQVLGQLFDLTLQKKNARRTIVVATSGDTGGAAVDAFAGKTNVDLFVMHPEGRVSEAQRRQMTGVDAPNVHNIAVAGSFDDCQRILKSLFADEEFRNEVSLGAVNSINWARIMAQTAYYLSTLAKLDPPAAISVPTGNFGDVFAGFVASQMGAEIGPLVIATNTNDILHRALTTGTYSVATPAPTLSPAMDIQVASNFERLLFEVLNRDAGALVQLMDDFADKGVLQIPESALATMRKMFLSDRVDDQATRDEIKATYKTHDILIDPHTAVGLRAARNTLSSFKGPRVVLATAHPAKFAETVTPAAGQAPAIPPRLAARINATEHYDQLPADVGLVMAYVRDRIS